MLFEISFEVCNMVGGIHTVVKTKAPYAKLHNTDYILIGPYLGHSHEFHETNILQNDELANEGIIVHEGYWNIPSKPKTMLIEFSSQFQHLDWFKSELFDKFQVDSLNAPFDVNEPMAFSLAAAKVAKVLSSQPDQQHKQHIVHAHEWMCGYANLYLKLNTDTNIKTVFTTHATMIGRALSSWGKNIYTQEFDTQKESTAMQIQAKHTAECACAKYSDVFTTVSDITAQETTKLLGKAPDVITYNGIDLDNYPLAKIFKTKKEMREQLHKIAHAVLGESYNHKAQFWIVSGRHEVANKGYDVTIDALAKLAKTQSVQPIVFVMVPFGHNGLTGDITYRLHHPADSKLFCTHFVQDNDLLQRVLKVKDELNIIYVPAYVEKGDGLFNADYMDVLCGFDLAIFPSNYEPWGYTPLEAITCGVRTITSNTTGFGQYYGESDAVKIVKRKTQPNASVVAQLIQCFSEQLSLNSQDREKIQLSARQLAYICDWDKLYAHYLEAYKIALSQ